MLLQTGSRGARKQPNQKEAKEKQWDFHACKIVFTMYVVNMKRNLPLSSASKQRWSSSPRLTKHAANGFTLIELLVVLAIIGLLSSLVATAVVSSLSKAKSTACRSNMRQLGVFIMNYAVEEKGRLPPGGRFRGSGKDGWAGRVANTAWPSEFNQIYNPSDAAEFYASVGRVFNCPADTLGRKNHTKSYLAVLNYMGKAEVENPSYSDDSHWGSGGGGVLRPETLDQIEPGAFLLVEGWMAHDTASCGGNAKIWNSGCDGKVAAASHFLNFPAHGKGKINRNTGMYDPWDHSFTFNALHADGSVRAYNVDPGNNSNGDPYLYYGFDRP
jgi:prepilin-type N-terminal cleavage/methylation domain-containing protein